MKKCPKCNFCNPDNGNFCQKCGSILSEQHLKKSSNKIGTSSLVLGIIGLFLSIVLIGIIPATIGLILGMIALSEKSSNMGRGIAGVVLSAVSIIIFVLMIIIIALPDNQEDDAKINEISLSEDGIWATDPTEIKNFKYSVEEDKLIIEEYNGDPDKIYVDSEYEVDGERLSVSALKDGTFLFSDVESVILAEGISSIDDNTFNSCDAKYLYLPSTLEAKEASFWNYFHDVEEIYYGGSNEQWNEICQVKRDDLDVKKIYCNVSIDDLGTDESKSEPVKMISNEEKITEGVPEKSEEKEKTEKVETQEDKFVSDSSEYISEDIARKLYGIIVNDIGFSDVQFKGKNEMANSVWDISCDGISILAVASDDVYRIWNSDCTFYEEGTVVTTKQQMESTVISSDERSKFYFMAQEIVTQCLKNPSSADFPSITFSPQDISMEKKDDIVAVQSYVDATNSVGGQVRSKWTVEFRVTDLDNLFYEVLYVNIDGQTSGTYVELD